MILNHLQIAELVQRGMVSGHQDDLLNGTSLDVRLANVFKQEVPGKDIKEDEYAMLNLNQREPMNVERVELAYPWDARRERPNRCCCTPANSYWRLLWSTSRYPPA